MAGHGFHLHGCFRRLAPQGFRLRPAGLRDLDTVLPWLGSRQQMQWWGAPALEFPPDPARVWQAIHGAAGDCYVLADPEGTVLGFGQAQATAPGTVHLNRIIVAPGSRGRGVGRALCLLLMERTAPAHWTLKVFQENLRAAGLFRSLGFQESPGESRGNLLAMHCDRVPLPGIFRHRPHPPGWDRSA